MTRIIRSMRVTTLVMMLGCLLFASCNERATVSASTPATQPTTGSIVVVVLADHYTAAEESKFNQHVTNLFTNLYTNGMLVDPDYDDHASAFQIIPVFEAWNQYSPTPSNYGYTIGGNANCSVGWIETGPPGTTTAERLEAAAGAYNPTHIVVIGNYTFDFGCTLHKDWTYIARGAVGKGVLAHEFGHLLAELFDEYSLSVHDGQTYPQQLNCRNCSTQPVPYWGAAAYGSFVNQPPCDYYRQGIVHPYPDCKMARTDAAFCPICRDNVNNAIAFYHDPEHWNPSLGVCPVVSTNPLNPSPPRSLRINGAGLFVQPPTAQSIVRVLVSLDRQAGTARVQRVTEAKGKFVAPDRRLGVLAYEVVDNDKLLSVGVIQGDPFQVRDYRGGSRHGTSQINTASVVVLIPNETKQDLTQSGRAVQIAFYRLTPTITAPRITRQVWTELKAKNQVERLSQISPDELRKAM